MNLSPKESNLIECLLIRENSRYELGDKCGSLNIPDVVMRIRNKGLNIVCKRKPMINRYSQTVRPGYYSIPDDQREKAKKMIASAVTETTINNQVNSHKKTDNPNGITNRGHS